MSRVKMLMILGIVLATFWVIPNANADVIYTLNVDYCSTGCLGGGTGGTVTLHQLATNEVQVFVDLTTATPNTIFFHDTIAFDMFTFNLIGSPTISVTGLPATFFNESNAAGSFHQDGAGFFMYAVDCTGCGNGVNQLTFDVTATGLTEASFHLLSTGGDPSAFFSVNAFRSPLSSGCTGVIGADGNTTPETGGSNTGGGACGAPVPEPGTLLLLGSGLVGLGTFGWRRIRR